MTELFRIRGAIRLQDIPTKIQQMPVATDDLRLLNL